MLREFFRTRKVRGRVIMVMVATSYVAVMAAIMSGGEWHKFWMICAFLVTLCLALTGIFYGMMFIQNWVNRGEE